MVGKGGQPWLETAVDLTRVLSISDGELFLNGKKISENQLVNLKSEAELMAKMSLWPMLVETVRAEAVSMGINRSQNFEHVLTAKAMILLLDWQKAWTEAIRSAKIGPADVKK